MTARIAFVATLTFLAPQYSASAQTAVSRAGSRWIIQATGTAETRPDTLHLLMKMEYESARAMDSSAAGEKRLKDFLAAVEELRIPGLKWRVVNNVITPAQGPLSQGFT